MHKLLERNEDSLIIIVCGEKDFYKGLNPNAGLFYGLLLGLCNDSFQVSVDKAKIAKDFVASEVSVSRWISTLKHRKLIKEVKRTSEQIAEALKKKGLSGLGLGGKVCQWCGIKTAILHKHHYPVLKSRGGKETVDICPNCHSEFHCGLPIYQLILTEQQQDELRLFKEEMQCQTQKNTTG